MGLQLHELHSNHPLLLLLGHKPGPISPHLIQVLTALALTENLLRMGLPQTQGGRDRKEKKETGGRKKEQEERRVIGRRQDEQML